MYFALFTEVGIVLALAIVAGIAVGAWVDERLQTLPIFLLVGLLTGMALGAFAVHRIVTRFLARF